MRLRLIQPNLRYAASYLAGLRESLSQSANPAHLNDQIHNLPEHIKWWRRVAGHRRRSRRTATYWLVDGHTYLGLAQIRLVPSGRDGRVKSHLYYEIRPSRRGKGLGVKLFKLTLSKAHQLGIRRVLVSCEKTNTQSRWIIEQAGGALLKTVPLRKEGNVMLLYEFRSPRRTGRIRR